MEYEVIIVGAGPGGLACAESLAAAGVSVLVLEKNSTIGRKVCAGGITWNGLLRKAPGNIAERTFNRQHIFTPLQKACINADTPMIATVDRVKLGETMLASATAAGATVLLNSKVTEISHNSITVVDRNGEQQTSYQYKYLVGADGSSSLVRRYLKLPINDVGVGINYQLPGHYPEMEWHIDTTLFRNGYSWIFPHRDSVSVGAYVDRRALNPSRLKQNLIKWAQTTGYNIAGVPARAELINYDFKGYRFDNIFLIGDAAGLASGLTGEGIYSAIVSGEGVAEEIINNQGTTAGLSNLIKNNRRHAKLAILSRRSKLVATFATETVTLALRTGLLDFSAIEMAYSRKHSTLE